MDLYNYPDQEHPAYRLADQLLAMFERSGIPPTEAFPGIIALMAEQSVLAGMKPERFDEILGLAKMLFMEMYRNRPKEDC